MHEILVEWTQKVEEQTQGRVKITIFPAQSLASLEDMYDSVLGGIADIGFAAGNMEAERWGLNLVFSQPALGAPFGEQGVRFVNDLWN